MSIRPKGRGNPADQVETIPSDLPMPTYDYYVADNGSFSLSIDPSTENEKQERDQFGGVLQNVTFRF